MEYVTLFEIEKDILPTGTLVYIGVLILGLVLLVREIRNCVIIYKFTPFDIIPMLFLVILCICMGVAAYKTSLNGGSELGMHIKQYYENDVYLEAEGPVEKFFQTESSEQFYVQGVKFVYQKSDNSDGLLFGDAQDIISQNGQYVRIRYCIMNGETVGTILKIEIKESSML